MKPRRTIFDSENERELFTAIHGTWEPHYRLYPHVPYANLIDLDPQRLDPAELSFLHKTTVDYALATAPGRPVLALEFDGLGHGFAKDGHYVQKVHSRRDPKRQWKLDLKCRVAEAAGFPFAVVSYDEKTVVDEQANLTVVHGMIGGFLAKHHMGDRIRELMELEADTIANLSPREQYDYVQDYVILPAELDADTEWNPLVRRAIELQEEVESIWRVGGAGMSWPDEEGLPPEADPESPTFDPLARAEWLRAAPRTGWTATIETPLGRIEQTIWVRNIHMPGTGALHVAGQVSELLAWQEALRQARAWQAAHPGEEPPPLPPIKIGGDAD